LESLVRRSETGQSRMTERAWEEVVVEFIVYAVKAGDKI
jgi:hypothetical protein